MATTPAPPTPNEEAAERVRAYLVTIRGGAVFLSPADAALLDGWLAGGIAVPEILQVVDRVHSRRRARRARRPLDLRACASEIERVRAQGRGARAEAPPLRATDPSIDPCADLVVEAEAELGPLRREIAADPAAAMDRALAIGTRFYERAWERVGGRPGGILAEAEARIAEIVELVEPGEVPALVEAEAREILRERYPAFTATALIKELGGAGD